MRVFPDETWSGRICSLQQGENKSRSAADWDELRDTVEAESAKVSQGCTTLELRELMKDWNAITKPAK